MSAAGSSFVVLASRWSAAKAGAHARVSTQALAIQANHRFNSQLWAEEDLARRTTVEAREIAANKRAIDGFNQARNDATEQGVTLRLSRVSDQLGRLLEMTGLRETLGVPVT